MLAVQNSRPPRSRNFGIPPGWRRFIRPIHHCRTLCSFLHRASQHSLAIVQPTIIPPRYSLKYELYLTHTENCLSQIIEKAR